jgi:hypothetical protein
MDQLAIEVGSVEGNRLPSFLVSASELVRRLAFPEGSRCACKNVNDSLIFVRALVEDALARYGGAGGEVPFTIYAVEASDHKIVCLYPDCVCKALTRLVNDEPGLADSVFVDVKLVRDGYFDLGNSEHRAVLKNLSEEFCAAHDSEKAKYVIETVISYILELPRVNAELARRFSDWLELKDPKEDPPPKLVEDLGKLLGHSKPTIYRMLWSIFFEKGLAEDVTSMLRARLKEAGIVEGDGAIKEELKPMDKPRSVLEKLRVAGNKAGVGSRSNAQAEPVENGPHVISGSKAMVIKDILGVLDISGDDIYDSSAKLGKLTLDQLEELRAKVRGMSREDRARVRELLLKADIEDFVSQLGLGGESADGKVVEVVNDVRREAREASEDFVNAMRALGDAERGGDAGLVGKAWEGSENSLARVFEAGLRARLGDGRSLRDTSVRLAKLVMILMRYPGILKALGEVLEELGKRDRLGELAELLDVAKVVLVKCGRKCDWVWGLLINSPERLEEVRGLLMARSDAELAYELCTRLRTALASLRMHDEGASLEGICDKLGNLADQAP